MKIKGRTVGELAGMGMVGAARRHSESSEELMHRFILEVEEGLFFCFSTGIGGGIPP